jgi:hypothetical protein
LQRTALTGGGEALCLPRQGRGRVFRVSLASTGRSSRS